MEDKKEKSALNDELLDRISGGKDLSNGFADTVCEWNLNSTDHEWVPGSNNKLVCKYCGVCWQIYASSALQKLEIHKVFLRFCALI